MKNAVETFAVNNCEELTLVEVNSYDELGECFFGNILDGWGNERTTLGLFKNHRNQFAVVANLDWRHGLEEQEYDGYKVKLEEEKADYSSKISTWRYLGVSELSAEGLAEIAKATGQDSVQFYTLD